MLMFNSISHIFSIIHCADSESRIYIYSEAIIYIYIYSKVSITQYCIHAVRETASLGQQMLNAPVGINGLYEASVQNIIL